MTVNKENKQNIKKDFIYNTIGSTINAFISLFLMIIVTRINGVKEAGIFTFAFSTATLFYIIGIYAGRVYQVTEKSNISKKDFFVNKVITCIIMLLVSIIFLKVKNYSYNKTIIIFTLCILKMIEAFEEIFYGYLQQENKLYKVGISLILKNVISIIAFLIIDYFTENILISSISLILCYLLVIIFYDSIKSNSKSIFKDKVNWNNVLSIFIKGFFTFSLSFLTMYIINIPRYAIDSVMTDEFSTIFGILIMPASVMVLLAQFVLQPFIMKLKNCLEEERIKEFSKIVIKIVLAIVVLGIIVLIGTYFLGIPILELLYGISLKTYKTSLIIVMLGASMYSITIILSNILISMRITFLQALFYLVNVIISLIVSYKFVKLYGVFGACSSYCLIMFSCLICFTGLMVFSVKKIERTCMNAKD